MYLPLLSVSAMHFFKKRDYTPLYALNCAIFRSFMEANKLISEEAKEAIEYLFDSIEKFYTKEEFLELLSSFGFKPVVTKEFMGGIAATIVAVKEV